MGKPLFTGTATAIITPFKPDGAIDYKALKKIIDHQVTNGIEAIVVCGSTGESATLKSLEKSDLIIKAVEFAAKRIKVIAGTGSNDTQASIDLTLIAKEHGVDGVLLVAPYYNKPTQDGLFWHFKAIADIVNLPIIIYNVPGRTAVNITAATQLNLARECKNIIGTKEASGNLEQMMEIIQNAPSDFSLYSGDDALTLPAISCGAKGVVSVISNYAPKDFGDMVRLALKGKFADASKLHYNLFELMKLNFIESNPAPAKAAMAMLGLSSDVLRMPLINITDENYSHIFSALKKAGFKPRKPKN